MATETHDDLVQRLREAIDNEEPNEELHAIADEFADFEDVTGEDLDLSDLRAAYDNCAERIAHHERKLNKYLEEQDDLFADIMAESAK